MAKLFATGNGKLKKSFCFNTKNAKLRKDKVASFGLEPVKTCPGSTPACRAYCYGLQGNYRRFYKTIKKGFDFRLMLTKQNTFVFQAVQEIKRRHIKVLRWNCTGDFYGQRYLNKVIQIAQQTPDTVHYCYSKSHHLTWTRFLMLSNTKMIQSTGSRFDDVIDYTRPDARIFDKRIAAGYSDCSKSDLVAIKTPVKIGLLKKWSKAA